MTHSQGKEGYISVINVFICYQYLQVALELHCFPTMPNIHGPQNFLAIQRHVFILKFLFI